MLDKYFCGNAFLQYMYAMSKENLNKVTKIGLRQNVANSKDPREKKVVI